MRRFSVRPTLRLRGRRFKGPRGWSGKPAHPPLTDFPIVAYVLAAVFDVISAIGGAGNSWAHELWHAGTFTFLGGAAVSVFTILAGFWDAWKSSEAGTQVRRTINTHATIMVTVTLLAAGDIAWRLVDYHNAVTPVGIAVLSGIIAGLVSLGAEFGGSLVYDYGFNVETAGDHPAWHKSEQDVLPGDDRRPSPASGDRGADSAAAPITAPMVQEPTQSASSNGGIGRATEPGPRTPVRPAEGHLGRPIPKGQG